MSTTTSTSTSAALVREGHGERLTVRDTTVTIRAAAPRLTVTDHELGAGFPGPPIHVHPGFDELFFVLAGRLAVRAGDDVHLLAEGDSVFVPGDLPHTFAAEQPTRFLVAMGAGGFERYFRAMAAGDLEEAQRAGDALGYRPA